MNQQVINYLKENKDKYPKEVLIKELEKAGYNPKNISEGVGIVFGVAKVGGFWDFKSKKVYTNRSEKVKDFLFGFLGIIVVNYFLYRFAPPFGIVVGFVLYFFTLFYFVNLNRRKYIVDGLIFTIIFSIIVAVTRAYMFLF